MHFPRRSSGLFYQVNVFGTKTVLAAAAADRMPKVLNASSTGNVYNGNDFIDCDEDARSAKLDGRI